MHRCIGVSVCFFFMLKHIRMFVLAGQLAQRLRRDPAKMLQAADLLDFEVLTWSMFQRGDVLIRGGV